MLRTVELAFTEEGGAARRVGAHDMSQLLTSALNVLDHRNIGNKWRI